jgi:putative hemolysin
MAEPQLKVKLATSEAELLAAQRLRYHVFVEELGGGGVLVDHQARFERDRFDPFFDHLILIDQSRDAGELEHVVGVYRLMRAERAAEAGQFYSEDEYDLEPLTSSGRKLLELGRSCVHPDYRGGSALYHLWTGLAAYISSHGVELLFGVASFHGTDVQALAQPLSMLHHRHLAPAALRVRSKAFQSLDLVAEADLDRRAAMLQMPGLIKAYLRLGGVVGDGAYIDHAFNTTDICLIMDTAKVNSQRASLYGGQGRV